ncbi:MAG TPA: hydroxysqualene dehydroxylase HpnE [Stellaceae bacterium]|nr:hydroxysqualene dehydroxylase HpnE [Stellaceae bacterium]
MRVHVVGAGLAGLSCAIALARAGVKLVLHEAAPQAGGRCRSYEDAGLGCRIDNGNHLLFSGNQAAMTYLREIGALHTMAGPSEPEFRFLDLTTNERWTVRPSRGRVPWWLFHRARRVPGTSLFDYARGVVFLRAGQEAVVSDYLDPSRMIFRRFWQPLAVAALNTAAEEGSARLFAQVLRESFGAGGEACRPLVPRDGLSESLVTPALTRLAEGGAEVRFGSRLRAVETEGDLVTALDFDGASEAIQPADRVVLALPAAVTSRLLPGITAPDRYRSILNAHYRVTAPTSAPLFIGLIGGTAEWVFRKSSVLSVTVSAADRLIDLPAEALAATLWPEVARAYELPSSPLPPYQIVKERRATFAATPDQAKRRPPARTAWRNLALAGDWTATGLPATIEGAIRSGNAAAEICFSA